MHILIVDPSRTVLKLLRTSLATLGHQVSMAQDGATALATASAKPDIDVLITSLELASLSGLELCWAVRSHAIAERRPVYIIAMSVQPSDRKFAEVLDAGADELIQKSVNETFLAARLRAAARAHAREMGLIEMATRDPLRRPDTRHLLSGIAGIRLPIPEEPLLLKSARVLPCLIEPDCYLLWRHPQPAVVLVIAVVRPLKHRVLYLDCHLALA